MLGSITTAPVAWLGMATLAVAPSTAQAQSSEPPCDPADAGDNDNDGDENCIASTQGKNLGSPKKPDCDCTYPEGTSGDPIDNATGNIYLEEDDLQGGGAFPLRLTRSYNSSTASLMYMSSMSTSATSANARPLANGKSSTSSVTDNDHPQGDDRISRSELANVVYPLGANASTSGIPSYVAPFGVGWSFSLGARLLLDNAQPLTSLEALRGDGQVLTFTLANGVWSTDADLNDHLTAQTSSAGAITGWTLTDVDLNTEQYDATGHLLSLTNRAGMTQIFAYSTASTPTSVAPAPGLLISATDAGGRIVQFTYNAQSRVNTVMDASGGHYVYAYDSNGDLTSVTYPDNSVRQYIYTYSGLSSFYLLKSVVDETNTTYASYTYNTSYQIGTSSSLAGGVNAVQLVLGVTANNTAQTTDALGAVRNYATQFLVNGFRNSQVQAPCLGCATSINTTTYAYNANGYVASETHVLGDGSTPRNLAYTWDTAHNLLLTFVDGSGSPQQRTTTNTWNASLRVPLTRIVQDNNGNIVSQEAWVYNTAGQVLADCRIDPSVPAAVSYSCAPSGTPPAGVRRDTTTYCAAVDGTQCPLVGLPLTHTDSLGNTTSYAYYLTASATSCGTLGVACYQPGDLRSVTDALGHVTTIASYDSVGRVTRTVDPNGVITDLTYTPRGWLSTRTVRANANGSPSNNDATITIGYTAYGAVASITDPDGIVTSYSYDAAHRLTKITDALGNYIQYTLDAAGNRLQERTFAAGSSTPSRSLSHTYNILGQLTKVTDGLGKLVFDASANGAYDGNGDLIASKDGNGIVTTQSYDALNRGIKTIENYNGTDTATQNTTIQQTYDALDRLTQVIDPSNLTSVYNYDGLDNPTSLQSPDSGLTSRTFDAVGNVLTSTDGRNVVATNTYDALNRMASTSYPDTTLNVTYAYDTATNGYGCSNSYPIGRLGLIGENRVVVDTFYCYDNQGRITGKTQETAGGTDTIAYTYTPAGRLGSVTYPNGNQGSSYQVNYAYDAAGRLSTVTLTPTGGSATTVVSGIQYLPFGPISAYTLGNGQTVTRTYNTNYSLTDLTSPALNLHFARDAMDQITAEGNAPGASPAVESYAYDPLGRLTNVSQGTTTIEALTYNGSDDRLNKTGGVYAGGVYGYQPGSHRLTSTGSYVRTADANGNTTAATMANGLLGFGYDARNRLSVVQSNGNTLTQFTYNSMGQRIQKSSGAPYYVDLRYLYDEQGQMLAEYNGQFGGNLYVWMDNIPVATVSFSNYGNPSQVSYVTADHLGTPRAVSDSAGATIWSWPWLGNPFGELVPTSAGGYVLNLRSPGQYYDAETGLSQNGNRDYDPTTGRFFESDPIELNGGISTYGYAGENPLSYIDPLGLCAKHPDNPKCKTPIMQPAITSIFGKMGKDLGIDPLFIMSSALQESGWQMPHVYGTNSSSHGKSLNNLFGQTYGGGNNIAYSSLNASAAAWEQNWGSYLTDMPQTIQAYARDLNQNPHHMYNSNPAYPGLLADRYKQLRDAAADCGVSF